MSRPILIVTLWAATAAIVFAEPDLERLGVLAGDLKAKNAKTRKAAAESAGKLGKEAEAIARPLCDATLDANRDVRLAALDAIGKVTPDLHKSLSTILLDTDPDNIRVATEKLVKLGEKAQPAVGVLIAYLSNSTANPKPTGPTLIDDAMFRVVVAAKPGEHKDIQSLMKIAGPLTKYPAHRTQALGVLRGWARDGGDKANERRRELLPLIKAGIATPEMCVYCLEIAGSYGEVAADLLPLIRNLKLSNSKAIREAATAAAAKIEAKK